MNTQPAEPGTNRILQALAEGRPAWGTWVQTRSVEACEAAAATGYDFVMIDLQHGNASVAEAANLILAVQSRGSSPIVRLPQTAPTDVARLLDAGAHGVLAPELRTGEEARRIVEATRYAPRGRRGACPTVGATAHGVIDWESYRRWADSQILAWGLIETVEAIDNIDDIVAAGLHALVLGPFDLSMAMGLNGQVDHPDVLAALDRVMAVAHAAGLETVAVLFDEANGIEEGARRWLDRNTRIITATSDRWCLTQGMGQALTGLRNAYR